MASINNPLFSIFIKSTGNNIGDAGTTSMSDALKSNTTLTKLNLWSEEKRNDTLKAFTEKPLYSLLIQSTDNAIGGTGATSLSDALKSNTTLTKLDLSCKDKRNNTQMLSINNPLFSFS